MESQSALAVKHHQLAIQADPTYYLKKFTNEIGWARQTDIIRSTFFNPVTSVRSCHGAGKSWIAARCALAFLMAYKNSYVITTAPTFRQVEHILWREMRSAYRVSKIPLGGRMLETPRLNLGDQWFAMGISTKDPDAFQGLHPPSGHILVVADEAAGIHEDIYIAIDAVLSSEGARLLMIGNPTSVTGRFYRSHHTEPTTKKYHISCFDTPNFTNNGIKNLDMLMNMDMEKVEIVSPNLITPMWVLDKVTKWGVDTPMFQARCLGQFPSAEADTLIPLNVIEEAATDERREELENAKGADQYILYYGVDVARYGDDKTVITPRTGPLVAEQIVNTKQSETETAGRVRLLPPGKGVFVDADGVGGGVADILRDDKVDGVTDIHGSASPVPDDSGMEFINLRSQLWWHAREKFLAGQLAIPNDEELMSQLATLKYKITRRGIQVEPKDEIKKRTKVSPDKADSLVYSLAEFLLYDESITPSIGKSLDELYNQSE